MAEQADKNQIISKLLASNSYIVVNKNLISVLDNDLIAAVMLCELITKQEYFSRMNQLSDGYFYYTIDEFSKIGIKKHSVSAGANLLKYLGILDTKRAGLPAKTYYKINYNRIEILLKLETSLPKTENSKDDNGKQQGRKQETVKPKTANINNKEDSREDNKDNNISTGETGSESSNPDKQTKITLTKEQDTPEKRKIDHTESSQTAIPSQTIGSDSEKPVRSISPKERFLEIHRQIANEINLGRRIIEDISALPEIVEILEESTEKFTQLCRFYLADEFYRDKGFSQKSLLSCLNNRNVFAVEPVKKTAYNTRDYNSPEHKAEIAKIVQAAENRQKGIVPEQAPRKTLAQAVKERMAREKLAKEMEELKHAV